MEPIAFDVFDRSAKASPVIAAMSFVPNPVIPAQGRDDK